MCQTQNGDGVLLDSQEGTSKETYMGVNFPKPKGVGTIRDINTGPTILEVIEIHTPFAFNSGFPPKSKTLKFLIWMQLHHSCFFGST